MGCGASGTLRVPKSIQRRSQSTAANNDLSDLGHLAVDDEDLFQVYKTQQFPFLKAANNVRDQYIFSKKTIGQGSYGEVWKGTHRVTGKNFAIKAVHYSKYGQNSKAEVLNEFQIMRKLDHPNVLKAYEYYEDTQTCYFVTEYCEGGNLLEKIKDIGGFSEKLSKQVMKQLIIGLYYLHNVGIMHRDIKPENILFDRKGENFTIKIADFGLAKQFQPGELLQRVVGTMRYSSPEKLMGQYDEKSDIWSAGLTLHRMINYERLFGNLDGEALEKQICSGKIQFSGKNWKAKSEDLKSLVKNMTRRNSIDRINTKQALEHQWLTEKLEKKELHLLIKRNFSKSKQIKTEVFNPFTYLILDFYRIHFLERKESDLITKLFQSLDTKSQGFLIREDVQEVLCALGEMKESSFILECLFGNDKEKNEKLYFKDFFTRIMVNYGFVKRKVMAKAYQAFLKFEETHSSEVDLYTFKDILNKIAETPYNDDSWTLLIKRIRKLDTPTVEFLRQI